MKTIELKQLQSPLKIKYRNDPSSAIVTLKAKGKIGEGITCKIETGRALSEAGLHPATGGSGLLACSGDLLLEALVACAGVTLSAVATSMEIEIRNGTVIAEGDLDFRGTLGINDDVPVGFKEIRLQFVFDSHVDSDKVEKLLKLTERYCVVYQTLKNRVRLKTTMQKD